MFAFSGKHAIITTEGDIMLRIFLMLALVGVIFSGCAPAPKFPEPTETKSSGTEPVTSTEPPLTSYTEAATLPPETTVPEPDPILLMLESMTIEEKVGQLFLARCPETDAIGDIQKYHLGGYILFGRDFDGQTPDSRRQTIAGYQSAADIPLLIAVDEEGGTVCRVSNRKAFRSTRFPSPRDLFDQGGMDAALDAEAEKSNLLAGLGINVNMAPVCDITTDPNAFMYKRSLGQTPEITGNFIAETVHTMEDTGIGSVLKHFPGYGNNVDTHVGIAIDNRSLEELENCDLIPFKAGIDAGCDAILVSHTFVNALDDVYPASLSPAVHGYIRENMGFDGVIVTDDLGMQAITDQYGAGEAAVLAVLAGNDLLCSTEYAIQYTAVLAAAQDGRISSEALDQAVLRILRWKSHLGLFDPVEP